MFDDPYDVFEGFSFWGKIPSKRTSSEQEAPPNHEKSSKFGPGMDKNKKTNNLESQLDFLSTFLTKITPKRAPERGKKRVPGS